MELKIEGRPIAAFPSEFSVQILDLDDADSTTRTADGRLNRDRVAVKRQIDMKFPLLQWAQISALLKQMDSMFFTIYYPDPMEGIYLTKTVYVGNRKAPVAIKKNGVLWWGELQITLTER